MDGVNYEIYRVFRGKVLLDGHWEAVPRCDIKLVRTNGEAVSDILFMNYDA